MSEQNNFKTTNTNDMMCDLLADPDKLISTDKREAMPNTSYDNLSSDSGDDAIDDDSEKHYSSKNSSTDEESEKHYSPEKVNTNNFTSGTRNVSDRELRLKKLAMFRKLGEMRQTEGINLTKDYDFNNSTLEDLEMEYSFHKDIRNKNYMTKWMGNALVLCVSGIEYLNDSANPLDFKLTGLSENVQDEMHTYYGILGEIYEKYNKPGSDMAPELRLIFTLLGAGFTIGVKKGFENMMDSKSDNAESNNKSDNVPDNIEKLKERAAKESEAKRKQQEVLNKEHITAANNFNDLKQMEKQERAANKYEKQIKNGTFNKNMMLTESPKDHFDNRPRMSHNEVQQMKKKKEIEEKRHMELMRRKNQNKQFENIDRQLKNEALNEILNEVDNDSDNESNDTTSSSASVSTKSSHISQSFSNSSHKMKKLAKKKGVVNIADDLDMENLSFGDSHSSGGEKRGRKKKTVDYMNISRGTKNKGKVENFQTK
jgi:hypothetical protein